MAEYELITQKDKEAGKDFNTLALQELKIAQYFFDHLRENERKYGQEHNIQPTEHKEKEKFD